MLLYRIVQTFPKVEALVAENHIITLLWVGSL